MKQLGLSIKNVWGLLKILWKEDRFYTACYFATCIAGAGLSIGAYILYKNLIDSVVVSEKVSMASLVFFSLTSYLAVEYVMYFTYNVLCRYYFDYLLRTKLQNITSRMFMEKMSALDFANLENGDVRNLMVRVQDNYMWRLPDIISTTNNIIYNVSSLIFTSLIALHYGLGYFLLLAVVALPFYILRGKYGNMAYSAYSSYAPKANYLWYMRSIFTNFQTLSEVKLYNLTSYFMKKTIRLQKELLGVYQKPLLQYSLVSILNYLITPVVMFFAITHTVAQSIVNHGTVGDFTLYTSALFAFSGQLAFILNNIAGIYEDNLYANDFFTFLGLKNHIKEAPNAIILPQIPREIVFDHVSFTYPQNKYETLHDISFTIKKGEDIAIVGHNGAGKTTLIKLLLRFYDPSKGRILVDGTDLQIINLASWYNHLGILFQDFARYNLTFKENVAVGNIHKNQDIEDITRAATQAQSQDIIAQLPKGIEQVLGKWFDDSQELSTGQWQKVAIARALYREAPILIMDEPTANIDAQAESEIFENLKKVYREKSLIFISHRFSTVRMADNIFVIDKGTLTEHGSHEALLKKNGSYAKYFNLQKKGYE